MARYKHRNATAFVILMAGVTGCFSVAGNALLAAPTNVDSSSPGPDADARAADLCRRAFAIFTHAAINFEESTTMLRSSAYAVLDRVISLADACRDSTIVITGHSDSSGDEASNLRLSRDRAQAVADYLAHRGIARDRLSATGVGSSAPVADNTTRYGRSLNRRIEIILRQDGASGGN